MRLIYIALSAFLASCAPSKINVEKGTFQAIKPPNIYGNNRYLAEDINYIISFDANIGKNKTIPLPGIMNEYVCVHTSTYYPICLSETPANIHYRLIENTLGFQFYRATKNDYDFYFGLGGGIQNFPYGFLIFGYNGKSIEFGGAAYWGLMIDKASYEGMWGYYNDFTLGINPDTEILEYIKYKDMKILHSYGGLTAYTSFYWEKFAINYSASIANPWLTDELPILYDKDKYYADLSFWFPFLLMQDIGISYTHGKIKYRLGVNQITGVKFPGQYWGLSVQVAYGW
jgi:hypothetical protein